MAEYNELIALARSKKSDGKLVKCEDLRLSLQGCDEADVYISAKTQKLFVASAVNGDFLYE